MFAPAIGPTIGGWITENYSWPWIFYINLVPGIILISAIAYGLDASPMRLPMLKKGDWTGILFMALGLGSLTVFLEEGTRKDWFGSVYITRLAIVTAIALPVFVIIELMRKKITPIVNLRLFARRNFLLGSMVNLVLGLCLYGFMYLLPVYLVQIQGYNAMQIGSTMMWVGLPQLVVMPFMPVLMKWIDKRAVVAFGLGMFGLSAMMMSGMTAETAHDQLVLPHHRPHLHHRPTVTHHHRRHGDAERRQRLGSLQHAAQPWRLHGHRPALRPPHTTRAFSFPSSR
jgi:DHA2 family multidrug resistance protein